MEHSPAAAFKSVQGERSASMSDVLAVARRSVAGIADLPVDAVSHCEKREDGIWRIVVDVVESPARLGDNDLLAAFEVHIDPQGELLYCSRIGRYRREDAADR